MVTTQGEITRRIEETDTARSTRRARAATTVGELARRHTELAGKVAEVERELGEVLTAAGDVIDVQELAHVTDIPAADLTRWRDQTAKPARRGGKRQRRPSTTKDSSGRDTRAGDSPRTVRPVAPAPPAAPGSTGAGGALAGAARN